MMKSTTTSDDHQVDTPPLPLDTINEVHAAWLRAGANGDVIAMRQLKDQFPEWLDLQRVVGRATSDPTTRPRSCSWTGFHLDTIGASALHTSAWDGELEIIQFLLEAGQDPNTRGNGDVTPIMVAILRLTLMSMRCMIRDGEAIKRNILVDCRVEEQEQQRQVIAVIDLLLKFGADVNARTQEGTTALQLSNSDDAYEVALFLLDAGAAIDTQDENGKTPLHYCVHENELLVTNLLLSRGANIDVEDANGQTALEIVVRHANLNLLQLFLNHHQWVATPARHDFATFVLLQAVECEVEEVVRFLVDNEYAVVTVRNAKGETPMHRAILRRNPALMELLSNLDQDGESVTAVTELLETPAHYAARYGSDREVTTLLQCLRNTLGDFQELGAGNPLNVTDRWGMTSLYIASTIIDGPGHETDDTAADSLGLRDAKVQLLLDHGALLFAPDVLAQKLADSTPCNSHRLIFPVQIQRCLLMWLQDASVCQDGGRSADLPLEALTKFCMRWMASIADCGSSLTLVLIVACAGYGHELLPILVGLPLHRRDLSAWLRQLKRYATYDRDHTLLLALHDEILSAWNGQNSVYS